MRVVTAAGRRLVIRGATSSLVFKYQFATNDALQDAQRVLQARIDLAVAGADVAFNDVRLKPLLEAMS